MIWLLKVVRRAFFSCCQSLDGSIFTFVKERWEEEKSKVQLDKLLVGESLRLFVLWRTSSSEKNKEEKMSFESSYDCLSRDTCAKAERER